MIDGPAESLPRWLRVGLIALTVGLAVGLATSLAAAIIAAFVRLAWDMWP